MAQYKSRIFDRTNYSYLLKKTLYSKLSNVTIVPVSFWLSRFISKSILSQFPVKVIQNGIDINIFKPTLNQVRKKYNISDDRTIVLGVLGSGFGVEKVTG
jgi:hypothetical protein